MLVFIVTFAILITNVILRLYIVIELIMKKKKIIIETTQFHRPNHTHIHAQCEKYVVHDTLANRQSLKSFY